MVTANFRDMFPPYSLLYPRPTEDLDIQRLTLSTRPPTFIVESSDPVSRAIHCGGAETQASEAVGGPRIRIPFICAANDRRPGGDWETGCSGYEEKLCRRSNLSATLANPWPGLGEPSNYPIPSEGGILSDTVVVCRGPAERYERLDRWYDLPVVSVPPTRWPKLKENGTKYSFSQERDMVREKMRGALRICLYNNYRRIVIGDFGLGNGHRNPPQEMAEIWRDVFLFDPELRGQFHYVIFAFDDPYQSTWRLILDEETKKEEQAKKKGKHSSSKSSRHHSNSSGSASSSHSASGTPTDLAIFQHVFDPAEIERVLSQPDPRYGLNLILDQASA